MYSPLPGAFPLWDKCKVPGLCEVWLKQKEGKHCFPVAFGYRLLENEDRVGLDDWCTEKEFLKLTVAKGGICKSIIGINFPLNLHG